MNKKLFTLLCIGMFLISGISVSAQETEQINKEYINEAITQENVETVIEIESKEAGEIPEYTGNIGLVSGNMRGINKPDESHDWSKGAYSIGGDMNGTGYLYTEKYFTDFTNATLYVRAAESYFDAPRGDVQVIIYRMEILKDKEIASYTVEAGTSKTYTLSNFQKDEKYYVYFNGGPFHVTGSLTRNE